MRSQAGPPCGRGVLDADGECRWEARYAMQVGSPRERSGQTGNSVKFCLTVNQVIRLLCIVGQRRLCIVRSIQALENAHDKPNPAYYTVRASASRCRRLGGFASIGSIGAAGLDCHGGVFELSAGGEFSYGRRRARGCEAAGSRTLCGDSALDAGGIADGPCVVALSATEKVRALSGIAAGSPVHVMGRAKQEVLPAGPMKGFTPARNVHWRSRRHMISDHLVCGRDGHGELVRNMCRAGFAIGMAWS